MLRSLQTIFRVQKNAVSCAILAITSGLKLSLLMIAPKYLKLCTSSRVFLGIWTSVVMPLLLFVMGFVFSPMFSMIQSFNVLSNLLTSWRSSVSLPASPSMSSANLQLVSCLPPMLTVLTCPSNASVMIRSKIYIQQHGEQQAHVSHSNTCLEPRSTKSFVKDCAGCIAVYTFGLTYEVMTDIVLLHCSPQCCMPYTVKYLLEIYVDIVYMWLVVCAFPTQHSQIEYMFTGASACSESCPVFSD